MEGEGLLTAEDLASYRVIEREPLEQRYREFSVLTNPPPSFGGSLLALSFELLGRVDLSGVAFGSPDHLSLIAAAQAEVEAAREALFNLYPKRVA